MYKLEYCKEIREVIISPPGWYPNLKIQYGLMKVSADTYILWQVEGTKQVWSVPMKVVTAKHGPKYADHFLELLVMFREDLIGWLNDGLTEDWMKDYYNQFKLLIRF